jgi:hypothetical protein
VLEVILVVVEGLVLILFRELSGGQALGVANESG